MKLGEFIDGLIEPFAPRMAQQRKLQRMALEGLRQYDAAAHGRRTDGWRRTNSSADREVKQGLVGARNGVRELVRNNKTASTIVRQVVAHMIGDGIASRMVHENPEIQKIAQEDWDRWAEGKVDGFNDWYGCQKLSGRAVVEGGDALHVWRPDDTGPDGYLVGLEGDFLDHQKNDDRTSGRIVQGVEFDASGIRNGYWLFDRHPGDLGGYFGRSVRTPAEHVDHVYEQLRWGQTRGISWLAPLAIDLRDHGDEADAIRMKRKIEACLALVLTPGDDAASPLMGEKSDSGRPGPEIESLRPGMIFRARKGETASTVNPSSAGDGGEFRRQELMSMAAGLAPYHLISGDPSQANYSSLRAMTMGFWADLDDWQQNMLVPQMIAPAVRRRMRRLALLRGDRRFLQVTARHAMPVRRNADPFKDYAGELAEIRGGTKSIFKSLAERGLDPEEHFKEMADAKELARKYGLVLEFDPSATTQSGIIQAASGLAIPRDTSSN